MGGVSGRTGEAFTADDSDRRGCRKQPRGTGWSGEDGRRETGGFFEPSDGFAPNVNQSESEGLFDAFAGIPRALFLANVDDLTDVIGIVCADVGDGRGPLG